MLLFPLLLLLSAAYAATVPTFVPPAPCPTCPSKYYVGKSNGTLPETKTVHGRSFDRFIQIWLENTDYATAAANPTFQSLAKQGIVLTSSYAVTHPSEPNYMAVAGGSFFGLGDDNLHAVPSNVSTIVDLLEQKGISWAEYQENIPSDGYPGFNFSSTNYLNASAPPYYFYERKHNPLILYDSVASNPKRASLIRNFNDFAADVSADRLPQWMFITPNMVDDGHDTDTSFTAAWLEYWLVPLLKDKRFNSDNTLILLTFDENETYTVNNQVFSVLLGSAIPKKLIGTTDPTYYTHYSALSTVEANWRLDSLGRGDTNKTLSNVYSFVAKEVGYKNLNITGSNIPLTNLTTTIPGPLNANASLVTPWPAPNFNATGAGGGPVFGAPCTKGHGKGKC